MPLQPRVQRGWSGLYDPTRFTTATYGMRGSVGASKNSKNRAQSGQWLALEKRAGALARLDPRKAVWQDQLPDTGGCTIGLPPIVFPLIRGRYRTPRIHIACETVLPRLRATG